MHAYSCFLFLLELGSQNNSADISTYEDRTSRFFPPAPRIPRMPGLVSGDTGFMDDSEDSFLELANSSHQRFNILCSGDKDGSICFNIFGIFPIGKIVSYIPMKMWSIYADIIRSLVFVFLLTNLFFFFFHFLFYNVPEYT